MFYLAWILTLAVAALHAWFAFMEIAEWEKPRTMAVFGTDAVFAAESRGLAGNLGLYNAFLAFGLLLSLVMGAGWRQLVVFLLFWASAAGLYAGVTVAVRVALMQALPALLALLAWWAA